MVCPKTGVKKNFFPFAPGISAWKMAEPFPMSTSGVMEPRNAPSRKRTAPRIAVGVVSVGIVGARIRMAVASVRMMWVTPFMELCWRGDGI